MSVFTSGDDMTIRVEVETALSIPDVTIAVAIQSLHGTRVVSGWSREAGFPVSLTPGKQSFQCRLRNVNIRPGQTVLVNLMLGTDLGAVIDEVDSAVVVDVLGDERHLHLSTNTDQGVWVAPQEWQRV